MPCRKSLSLVILLVSCYLLPGWTALADDEKADQQDVVAGHSAHGEVFNEGPRQRAYLMGNTGKIDFAITTREPKAQAFFNQGIGQLHGFWYYEAERSFRQVAVLDPDCAMAYWGMAKANDGKRAKGFIQQAVGRKETASPREQLYIDGLAAFVNSSRDKDSKQAYAKNLEKIIEDYPDDLEAKAFLVMHMWGNQGDRKVAESLLDEIFAADPMHPAHHYRIHMFGGPKALASAALVGQSAPGIAHQWHMAGHVYSGASRFHDAVWQQEASSRVDHAYMIRDRVLPYQIHNYFHNQEWLVRNLNYVGRYRDAVALAKNLIELPRHPRASSLIKERATLFETLEGYELWDELIALADTAYLEPTDNADEQVKRLRYLGIAHGSKGDVAGLAKQIEELDTRLAKTTEEKNAADTNEKEKEAAPAESKDEAQEPAQTESKQEQEPPSKKKVPQGTPKVLVGRAAIKDALAELRGYEALVAGDAATALANFDKAKSISKTRLARLHLELGDLTKAEELAKQAVDSSKNQVVPLATQVAIMHAVGKTKEAGAAFEHLRQISGSLESLDSPGFKRLEPIAKDLMFPDDWCLPTVPATDVGDRPTLDSLGPPAWRPSPAPPWSLPESDDQSISLEQYHGKPVVVIFYLGYGCVHCNEQLQRFAPKAKDFADAGISLLAISTDSVEDLKQSPAKSKDGRFPFPILSDAKLDAFKAYRAFDDYENAPLHGTFLIDAAGLIRWQDISFDPFMNTDFLLKEAKRLLRMPAPR